MAGFDTIDHCILKTKLEHYGIRNDELSLLSSFLENRYQYVSIDCFDSDIIKSNECSCIQGSKMAALVYNLYNNEIPLLHRLMVTPIYKTITDKQLTVEYSNNENSPKHVTLQYVDDSTNMISCKDLGILQLYINDFFLLIESFYNANKLALNASKSKLLVTCKNKYRTLANKIVLQASGYIIEQSKKIKILGIYYTSGLEHQPNINNIISKVNSRIISLRQIFKYSSIQTKNTYLQYYPICFLICCTSTY